MDPIALVPALVLGWFVRSWAWLVVAGFVVGLVRAGLAMTLMFEPSAMVLTAGFIGPSLVMFAVFGCRALLASASS